MFIAQDGRCAICERDVCEIPRGLYIDHDHKTGKVRGLLCDRCNMSLGGFKDNVIILQNAINYLIKQ